LITKSNGTSLKKAIPKLKNDKTPGLNGTSPKAFKSMNDHNLRTLFWHVKDFWDNRIELDEWHEGQVVPVPKKVDLADPKNGGTLI